MKFTHNGSTEMLSIVDTMSGQQIVYLEGRLTGVFNIYLSNLLTRHFKRIFGTPMSCRLPHDYPESPNKYVKMTKVREKMGMHSVDTMVGIQINFLK